MFDVSANGLRLPSMEITVQITKDLLLHLQQLQGT